MNIRLLILLCVIVGALLLANRGYSDAKGKPEDRIAAPQSLEVGAFPTHQLQEKVAGDDSQVLGNLWAKIYRAGGHEDFRRVLPLETGGYLTSGIGASGYSIMRLDEGGNPTWQKQVADPSWRWWIGEIVAMNNSSFLAVGGRGTPSLSTWMSWLVLFSDEGEILWQKLYGGVDAYSLAQVLRTSGGDVVAAGKITPADGSDVRAWVVKFDAAGDVIWQHKYDIGTVGANLFIRSLLETANGNLIVAGSDYLGDRRGWVMKLNNSGNLIWAKGYQMGNNSGISDLQELSDGTLMTVGTFSPTTIYSKDAWVNRLDANGNVIWSKSYGGNQYEEVPALVATNDGAAVVAGVTSSWGAGYLDVWLFKIGAQGEILWQKTYGGAGYDHGWDIKSATDGGFVIAADTAPPNEVGDAMLLKVDSEGDIGGSCSLYGESAASPQPLSPTVRDLTVGVEPASATAHDATAGWETYPVSAELVCEGPDGDIDLSIAEVEPIQVLEGYGLVRDKAAAVRVVVQKTGDVPVSDVPVRINTSSFVSTQFYVAESANQDSNFSLINDNEAYPLSFAADETTKTVYFFATQLTPRADVYQVQATVDYTNELPETNEGNNTLAAEPSPVRDVTWGNLFPDLYVHYFPYGWNDENLPGFNGFYRDSTNFISGAFPVSERRFSPSRTNGHFLVDPCTRVGRFSENELQLCALELQTLMSVARPTADRHVAVVPPGWFAAETEMPTNKGASWWEGIAHLSVVFAEIISEPRANGIRPAVVAHELGHTLELPTGLPDGCREDYDGCNPDRESYEGQPIGTPAADGLWVNRRIPMWYAEEQRPLFSTMGGYHPDPNYFGMIGYWMTNGDYNHLLVNQPLASQLYAPADVSQSVLATGVITATGGVALLDWYVIGETEPDTSISGGYAFVFEDENGNELHKHPFDVARIAEGGTVLETAAFAVKLPYIPDTARILIKEEDIVVAEKTISENTPTVAVVSPNGGEELSEELLIEWTANDADGDSLQYIVLYSIDGGATWEPLAGNLESTNVLWDLSGLSAGTQYLIKVVASDGFNTGEDVSDATFTVEQPLYLPLMIKE